jgi:hypothetical protein
MADEYWATFSIYDHRRRGLYLKSLILFDRVVIPIPIKPIGDLKQAEIERLDQDVDILEKAKAGVRFKWDSSQFNEMQRKTIHNAVAVDGELLTIAFNNDKLFATRFIISEALRNSASQLIPADVSSVQAVPVYGTRNRLKALPRDILTYNNVFELVLNKLPMPAENANIKDILKLREKPEFRNSMVQLRKWQMERFGELLNENNSAQRDRLARAAVNDLERWTNQYREAIQKANFDKVEVSMITLLSIGALLIPGSDPLIKTILLAAPKLFDIRKLAKPSWKEVEDKECAPAGVIYAASRVKKNFLPI